MEESVITGIFQNPKDIRIKNQLSDAFNNNMPSKFLLQHFESTHFLVVHSLSHVQRFATPWTAASQVSLSFTVSWSQLTFMSIESMMLSNHLILCYPLLLWPSIFPRIKVFSMSQLFTSGGQSIGVSASASVLPMNIQGLFPLGLTGLISLLSKGHLRVFTSTTVRKHQFFGTQPSLWSSSHIHTQLLEKSQL